MKLKQLLLVLLFALSTMVSSAALAWSPLDDVEAAVERIQSCYFVTASSEGEEASEEEEDEEPECD